MGRQIQWITVAILTFLAASAFAQNKLEKRTLVLNGHTGDITIFMVDGQPFINARTLVDIGHGNYALNGNTIILNFESATTCAPTAQPATPPPTQVPAPAAAPVAPQPASNALSNAFMGAAIQELAILKDWRSYMAYGITKGIPGDGSRMVLNQNKAIAALNLAQSVPHPTDADRSALPLLKTDFDNVNQWYNTLVQGRRIWPREITRCRKIR